MAAGAWNVFPRGKRHLGIGTFNLSNDVFNLSLHTAGASANLQGSAVSVFGSIGSESTGGGYTAGGNTLSSTTWTASGSGYKFDSTDWVVTGSIAAIKYAVVFRSAAVSSGQVLCYSTLSTAAFALTGTNTLTIQMATAGLFTLA